jgi:hypothetical protein
VAKITIHKPVKATIGKVKAPDKFKLPSGLSEPETDFGKMTWLIYGEPKIGKTSLLSHWDDPYFAMFEPGGKGLRIKQTFLPDWDTFLKLISALEENPDYCKTLVIDTGYAAYERCFDYCLAELDIDKPGDTKDFGMGWKFIDKEFKSAHDRIINLGLGFAVTAHSEEKDITKGGFTRHKTTTRLGAQATRFYTGLIDVIGYYHFTSDGERLLKLRGTNETLAGTRFEENFHYTDGEPIFDLDMGHSSKEAFTNLMLAFNNKLIKKGGDRPVKKLSIKIGK